MAWGNFARYFLMITYKRNRNSEQIMRKYIISKEFNNFSMIGHAFFILKLLKI